MKSDKARKSRLLTGGFWIECIECERVWIKFLIRYIPREDGLQVVAWLVDNETEYRHIFVVSPGVCNDEVIRELKEVAFQLHEEFLCPYLIEAGNR